MYRIWRVKRVTDAVGWGGRRSTKETHQGDLARAVDERLVVHDVWILAAVNDAFCAWVVDPRQRDCVIPRVGSGLRDELIHARCGTRQEEQQAAIRRRRCRHAHIVAKPLTCVVREVTHVRAGGRCVDIGAAPRHVPRGRSHRRRPPPTPPPPSPRLRPSTRFPVGVSVSKLGSLHVDLCLHLPPGPKSPPYGESCDVRKVNTEQQGILEALLCSLQARSLDPPRQSTRVS